MDYNENSNEFTHLLKYLTQNYDISLEDAENLIFNLEIDIKNDKTLMMRFLT